MNEIRIAALACSGEPGCPVGTALGRAADMIAEACQSTTDLICLPEIFAWTGLTPGERPAAAEPIDGPFSRAMADLAARHRVNILTPILERDAGKMFNTMSWFDRTGTITGTYRKVFTTVYEIDQGFCPGSDDFDVFQTEFGPIGCCVCFDLNFPEIIERIAGNGAKLIIFPSMFDGTALMQAWAKLHGMYFVSVAGSPYGSLVDPLGKVLIEPWRHAQIMRATLNLDFAVLSTDENRDKWSAVTREYGDAAEIDSRALESAALLTSRHPEQSALDMVQHMGLELQADYFLRSREKRQRALDDA